MINSLETEGLGEEEKGRYDGDHAFRGCQRGGRQGVEFLDHHHHDHGVDIAGEPLRPQGQPSQQTRFLEKAKAETIVAFKTKKVAESCSGFETATFL